MQRLTIATLVLLLAPSGCYLSHARELDGGRDPDSPRPDVPPDGPAACPLADACNAAFTVREGVCAPPARALDDGFERAEVSFGNPVGTNLSCWEVVAGDADIVSDGAGFEGPSDSGRNALDLNGWTSGTIARTVRVRAGVRYQLRFAYTRNPQMVEPTATGEVLLDGLVVRTLSASPRNSARDLQWSSAVIDVLPATDRLTIGFRSTNPGNGGLYLDTITLEER